MLHFALTHGYKLFGEEINIILMSISHKGFSKTTEPYIILTIREQRENANWAKPNIALKMIFGSKQV